MHVFRKINSIMFLVLFPDVLLNIPESIINMLCSYFISGIYFRKCFILILFSGMCFLMFISCVLSCIFSKNVFVFVCNVFPECFSIKYTQCFVHKFVFNKLSGICFSTRLSLAVFGNMF